VPSWTGYTGLSGRSPRKYQPPLRLDTFRFLKKNFDLEPSEEQEDIPADRFIKFAVVCSDAHRGDVHKCPGSSLTVTFVGTCKGILYSQVRVPVEKRLTSTGGKYAPYDGAEGSEAILYVRVVGIRWLSGSGGVATRKELKA
jgi:hypothetical protein